MRASLTLPMLALPLAGLAGCGPMPVDQAERVCLREAERAVGVTGQVGLGVGSDGARASSFEVEVSSDYILGRDPSDVYNRCVVQRSGQMPTRALIDQPGWRG